MIAESAGLRLGIALTLHVLGHPVAIDVIGDNLPVMRVAAANGRIRNDTCWTMIGPPVMHAAALGWSVRWIAVRRNYNKLADLLATRATLSAVRLRANAVSSPRLWVWTHPDFRHAPSSGRPLRWHDCHAQAADHPLSLDGPTHLLGSGGAPSP